MAVRELTEVQRRIASAVRRAGRQPSDVTLVAVSKGRSDSEVQRLYDSGHSLFAENRAEALASRLGGPLPVDITWHFVGSVQRRKVKVIASSVELLHSMDRPRLEGAWAQLPDPPPVLLQVNIAAEPQKHGYAPAEVLEAAQRLVDLGVPVRGLMILPPAPFAGMSSKFGTFFITARGTAAIGLRPSFGFSFRMGRSSFGTSRVRRESVRRFVTDRVPSLDPVSRLSRSPAQQGVTAISRARMTSRLRGMLISPTVVFRGRESFSRKSRV